MIEVKPGSVTTGWTILTWEFSIKGWAEEVPSVSCGLFKSDDSTPTPVEAERGTAGHQRQVQVGE